MNTFRIDQLRQEIHREFASNAYPGDARISERDPRFPDYEGNQIADFLMGKKWDEVTYDSLASQYCGDQSAMLHFLSREGFQYYLPAFLIIAIDFAQAGEIADAVCSALSPPDKEDQDAAKRFFLRVSDFSPNQKGVIKDVLHFLSECYLQSSYPDNPASDALQRYWLAA